MNEDRKSQTRIKSRIAVRKGSSNSIQNNKENVPDNASKRGIEKRGLKPPIGRKTLSSKKDNNSQANPVVKRAVKAAPDFSKLHKKWETKLATGKAVTKRANTKIEPFPLTKEVDLQGFNSDEDFLEDDVNEPANISQESEVLQETSKCCSCKSATTPATTAREFKIPTSIRKTFLSSVKTKEKKVEIKEDLFEFKPDNNALQSILNNDGIRSTPSKRTTAGCSPFNQKRTSIYYTGPRPDRSPSAFEKRLSMRRASKMMAKMRQPECSFEPSNTLVGVQEFGNRFTTTPLKELQNDCNIVPESIPEEISEEETTPNVEISWADTLKSYSQQETCSPVEEEETLDAQLDEEDKEALIAELEEEVRQTLANVALDKHTSPPVEGQHSALEKHTNPPVDGQHSVTYPSASKTDTRTIRDVSIPLQQRRDKPSIYRKLFTSPAMDCFENSKAMVEETAWNPGYLYAAPSSAVPRTLPFVSDDLVEQEYQTKLASFRMQSGSRGLGRAPVDSSLYSLPKEREYTSDRFTMPLAKGVTPLLVNSDLERNVLQDGSLQSASSVERSNIGVVKGMSTCPNGFESATSDSHWVSGPPALKESAKHKSLDAAASASFNSKLRGKMLAESAFQQMQPPSAGKIKSGSLTNFCTPVSEQKVSVPTPVRPVVAAANNRLVFVSRHRQIMREALLKSRDHAQEILLDAEVSLYARNMEYLRKYDHHPRLVNPVAKLFNEGDERHFVPVVV